MGDPISPELALVCPELRTEAIARLPTVFVDAFLAGPRASRVVFVPETVSARGDVRARVRRLVGNGLGAVVVQYLTLPALAVVAALLITLALTSIADVVRP